MSCIKHTVTRRHVAALAVFDFLYVFLVDHDSVLSAIVLVLSNNAMYYHSPIVWLYCCCTADRPAKCTH